MNLDPQFLKFFLDVWTQASLWIASAGIGIWASQLKPNVSVGLFAASVPVQKVVFLFSVMCAAAAVSMISDKAPHANWREAAIYTAAAMASIGLVINRTLLARKFTKGMSRDEIHAEQLRRQK